MHTNYILFTSQVLEHQNHAMNQAAKHGCINVYKCIYIVAIGKFQVFWQAWTNYSYSKLAPLANDWNLMGMWFMHFTRIAFWCDLHFRLSSGWWYWRRSHRTFPNSRRTLHAVYRLALMTVVWVLPVSLSKKDADWYEVSTVKMFDVFNLAHGGTGVEHPHQIGVAAVARAGPELHWILRWWRAGVANSEGWFLVFSWAGYQLRYRWHYKPWR